MNKYQPSGDASAEPVGNMISKYCNISGNNFPEHCILLYNFKLYLTSL